MGVDQGCAGPVLENSCPALISNFQVQILLVQLTSELLDLKSESKKSTICAGTFNTGILIVDSFFLPVYIGVHYS